MLETIYGILILLLIFSQDILKVILNIITSTLKGILIIFYKLII
jgi:hypothetical protein